MNVILVLLFTGLTLLSVSLKKSYQVVPLKELKKRAQEGDEFAKLLHRAMSYGHSLQAVLWFLIGVSAAGFFLTLVQTVPAWLALFLGAILIWLGFYWIPSGPTTKMGLRVAGWLAPVFGWLLNYLHPLLDKIALFVKKHRTMHVHTGLYDKYDLLDLLDRQLVEPGNRIEAYELDVAKHALTFGDKAVRDILTPRRVVKMVPVEESVGPVLMTELHASGFSRFPVYDGTADNIVGTVYLKDLTKAKEGGKISAVMRSNDLCYLHEEQPLTEALSAILKTHRQLMIVVNSFEEYVGIVTIEDILEQIVGRKIVDEFDQYDDLRAVAAKMAKADHKTHKDHAEPSESTKDTTEVVE